MSERVRFEVKDHIAYITMTRGDKMNALDMEMMEGLIEAGETLKAAADARVAILSGEGRSFCAGLDMGNFTKIADGSNANVSKERTPLATRTHGMTNLVQQVCWTWREAPVPVIAATHGVALGGGFQIMMGADIRYGAPKTRYSILEIRWGLVPDMGTTHAMTQVAREDVVKELAFTGRIFEAEEAQTHGFLTRICDDPFAAAVETASYIATRNPDAIRSIKRLFNEPADRFVADTLLLESVLQDDVIGSPNQTEAVRAELEGRPAKFG